MLRPYQQTLLDLIRAKAAAKLPVCAVAATGSGKSHLISAIAQGAIAKNTKTLILAHRKELIRQNQSKLGSGAIYCAGLDSKQIDLITFGSIASVFAKKDKFLDTKILLVDECHRLNVRAVGMYRELIEHIKPDCVIGFTATPFRLYKGENVSIIGEDAFFKVAAIGDDVKALIDQGYLSPLTNKVAKQQADLSGVKKDNRGEYKEADVEERMRSLPQAVTEIAEAIHDRKKIIVFTSGIKHANEVEQQLCSLGFDAKAVTSETGPLFRDQYIDDFVNGNQRILIGAQIFTEGFDAPNIDCVVVLRATQSLSLWHQIVGRGLRIAPGKENCLVLDFGRNFLTHGTLNDFTLSSADLLSSDRIGTPPVKICPGCQHLQPLSIRVCKNCFFEFQFQDKTSKLTEEFFTGDMIEEEPEFVVIKKIVYQPHVAKSGRDCMRVDYYPDNSDKVSEWVSFPNIEECYSGNHSELFLAKKLKEWLEKRGLASELVDSINSLDDLLMSCYSIGKPSEIMIVPDAKNARFKKITPTKFCAAAPDDDNFVDVEVFTEPPKLASDSTYWSSEK